VARARTQPTVIVRQGDLVVERDPRRASGRLLRQEDMDASYVDLADPTHLEFDYLRWIRIVLRTAGARRVLHVGGGACTLARALAAEDPDGRQEVWEANAEVLAIAREHLGLRRARGLRVRHGDGREHLASQIGASWQAVVVDAFIGAAVPRRLVTVQALADISRVAPLALINVVDNRAAQNVRRIAAGVAEVYPHTWTVGARVGNTIVAGARGALDLGRIRVAAAADRSPARLMPPGALAPLLVGIPPWYDE
jgi:spermidine synthase